MNPDETAALSARAAAAHQAGRLDEAGALYLQLHDADPAQAEPLARLGFIAVAAGQGDEAVRRFRQVLALTPDQPASHLNLAAALGRAGRAAEALVVYQRAAAMLPGSARVRFEWANVLAAMARLSEALDVYDAAMALAPNQAEIVLNRADILLRLGRPDAAVAGYDQALGLDPTLARGWSNRGVALQALDRPVEAVESYDRALAAAPGFVDALGNRGLALRELNRIDEALQSLTAATLAAPDNPAAQVNLGVTQLLAGDLEAGFRNHEARWRVEPGLSEARRFDAPLWLGKEDIAGKTLLLHAEQGFGDTLQFCRYAALATARGARVVMEVQPALVTLLRGLDGVAELVAAGEPLPPFDLHCPMMSLPAAFATILATIPAPLAYLTAPAERLAAWSDVAAPSPRLKVGVVWFGKPTHKNDRNRSLHLDRLLQALPEEVEVFSLQDRVRPADEPTLADHPRIRRFEDRLGDFADTAALAAAMDLVISVDTSAAHLAAATGRPTWVLLPFSPDWRWLLGRDDNPWYPSVRLFRQPAPGDWAPVMAELRAALTEMAARKH